MRRLMGGTRGVRIAVGAVLAVVVLGAAAARLTASPALCGSCHEMKPKVAAWKTSPHTRVGCPACHETPRPWYRFPQTLADRGLMLGRDLDSHFSKRAFAATVDTITLASIEATSSMPDAVCLRCHDPSRTVTMRYGTILRHAEHAARNGSCVSCHLWTGHPDPRAEKPLLLMARCFTCHGRASAPTASDACDVCHPESFDLRPASHAGPRSGRMSWQARHGRSARADRQWCGMCHEERFCSDCHGITMPHPARWTTSHGPAATKDRRVCERCHPPKTDWCGMCHHPGYQPTAGPWIGQHSGQVIQRGAAFCLECHDPVYCSKCHVRGLDRR